MAIIHRTTLSPGKLELLSQWLPAQPWYLGSGEPELVRAGGFRLDDPAGEVGIEFAAVTDQAVTYLVPMTYRGQELPDAAHGLIGTSVHGVLGDRWIYDGACDPVLITQLVALIQGQAEPQAQAISDTPDPTVTSRPPTREPIIVPPVPEPVNTPDGTELRLQALDAGGELLVRIHRVLEPATEPASAGEKSGVTAPWHRPDGTSAQGWFITAEFTRG